MNRASEVVLGETGKVKEELSPALESLASKYGWTYNSKAKTASLAKLLTSTACERQLDHVLRNPAPGDKKFDPFYREKSEFSTLKIIDYLKSRLANEGIKACVATEVKDNFGVYDVAIVRGSPLLILQNGQERVRIEVKASLGLPLEQIERYLWDPSPLIVCRVVTGHVVLLRPSDMEDFVLFSSRLSIEKAKRLLDGTGFTVPGVYCSSCPDISCPHNKHSKRSWAGMVKMPDSDYGDDLRSLFRNLPYVAERTSELVIQELKRSKDPVG